MAKLNCLVINASLKTVTNTTPESPEDMAALIGMTPDEQPLVVPLQAGEFLLTDPHQLQIKPNPHGYWAINGFAFAGLGMALTSLTAEQLLEHIEWIDADDADIPEPNETTDLVDVSL